MRSEDFSGMRTIYHKLLFCVIGFRRKERTGYKLLSYGETLEGTDSQRTETIFRSAN